MPLEIKTVSPGNQLFKGVIHGEAESGKTWLASTANNDPRLGPSLIIALEANMQGIELQENPSDYVEAKNEEGRWDIKIVEEIFWALASNSKEYSHYKTVTWDTYSEGYASQLQAEARTRLNKGVWESPESLSQYEYVQTNRKMRDLVTKLRDLQRNVIITCHSQQVEIKRGDMVVGHKWGFATSAGSREPLERLFPFVGFLEIKQPKPSEEDPEPEAIRVLNTKASPRYFSKAKGAAVRVGNLANTTMTEILDKMEGK